MKRFRVYYTNHWYYSQEEFETFAEAAAHGKKACFEFAVHERRPTPDEHTADVVYTWSPIGGDRYYSPRYRGVA